MSCLAGQSPKWLVFSLGFPFNHHSKRGVASTKRRNQQPETPVRCPGGCRGADFHLQGRLRQRVPGAAGGWGDTEPREKRDLGDILQAAVPEKLWTGQLTFCRQQLL